MAAEVASAVVAVVAAVEYLSYGTSGMRYLEDDTMSDGVKHHRNRLPKSSVSFSVELSVV